MLAAGRWPLDVCALHGGGQNPQLSMAAETLWCAGCEEKLLLNRGGTPATLSLGSAGNHVSVRSSGRERLVSGFRKYLITVVWMMSSSQGCTYPCGRNASPPHSLGKHSEGQMLDIVCVQP